LAGRTQRILSSELKDENFLPFWGGKVLQVPGTAYEKKNHSRSPRAEKKKKKKKKKKKNKLQKAGMELCRQMTSGRQEKVSLCGDQSGRGGRKGQKSQAGDE